MIDINKKYKLKDPAEPLTNTVKLLTILEDEKLYPVIGVIKIEDGSWVPASWSITGEYIILNVPGALNLVEDIG